VSRGRQKRGAALWGKDSLLIERMSHEGRGIATRRGKVVFVSGALSGEQVRVQCTLVKRDFDEADMLERIEGTSPSAQRVAPECPLYGECGGCSLQHWSPAAQFAHKQGELVSTLRALAPPALEPPITSAEAGFRHRLRLRVTRASDQRYVLGLRQRRSHEVVQVAHCLVASDAVNGLLRDLPALLQALPDLQGLREIAIDADSNQNLGLCFYFAAHPGEKLLSELRTAVMSDTVIALRVRLLATGKPPRSTRDDDDDTEEFSSMRDLLVAGELSLVPQSNAGTAEPSLAPLVLSYLPGDFTQTQWSANTALVSRALDWLQPTRGEVALDLFSGVGNFSLPLAQCAHAVHALEGDAGMIARVADNARRNGLENIHTQLLDLLATEVILPKADIAILDPPRAGAKSVCEALARSKVKRVVYVSCHPATLARDARILHDARFRLTRVAAVDMFVHTGHREAIALFERR
jgi:23S rRNA (uracil1939-C5)-methyltransferase